MEGGTWDLMCSAVSSQNLTKIPFFSVTFTNGKRVLGT